MGLFGSENEIIQGSGRIFCDKCFRAINPHINVIRNSSDIEGVASARIKARETWKNNCSAPGRIEPSRALLFNAFPRRQGSRRQPPQNIISNNDGSFGEEML